MSKYYELYETGPQKASGAAAIKSMQSDRSIDNLLDTIIGRIASAEQRQTDALDQMQERIARLSEGAKSARHQVPDEFRDAFSQVERSILRLADQIAYTETASLTSGDDAAIENEDFERLLDGKIVSERAGLAPQAQAAAQLTDNPKASSVSPLRSALSGNEASENSVHPMANADPYDFADQATAGNPDEPWDSGSAEELTRLYETGAAGLPYEASNGDALYSQESTVEYMASTSLQAMAAIATFDGARTAQQTEASSTPHPVIESRIEKAWLEDRFAEVAIRVEHILTKNRSEESIPDISERFEVLEERFGEAVIDLATRSDVASLGDVEACIAAMAEQLERTQVELSRISDIEAQIQVLASRVSDERLKALVDPLPAVEAPVIDAEQIADVIAARLALQHAEDHVPSETGIDKREIEELKNLVRTLVSEQRNEGEHTSTILDTMQQAMIRLLDRMDAVEDANSPVPGRQNITTASQPQESTPPTERAPLQTQERASERIVEEPVKRSTNEEAAHREDLSSGVSPSVGSPSFEDYKPRRATPEGEDADQNEPAALASHASAPPERQQFMAAARRTAQQANIRAKMEEGQDGVVDDDEFDAGEHHQDKDVTSVKSSSTKVRILAAALAIIAVGLGATKLFMISPGTVTSKTQKQEMLGHNATNPPAPANTHAPASPASSKKSGRGAANQGIIQPVGVAVDPSRSIVTTADLIRQQRHRQYARWSSGIGASQPIATSVPASLIPTSPTPSADPVTMGANAKRSIALPNALVGPLSLRLAAANGEPSAEFEVGARFAEGKGIQQDFKEAVKWYRRAATRSFALAQYRLATLYERGLGVAKDLARAKIWYQRAAGQGNVKAMHNLAVLSAGSSNGRPDYGTAARWFEQAANRGLKDSQFNLAILHESGLGVHRDINKAYQWFGIAARGGDKKASGRQGQIARQMKAEDISRADKSVAVWRRKSTSRLANDPHYAGEYWKKRTKTRG